MHLFPTGLDNSLFPAIFIGVILAFAATQTLGWTFTGLVVPGYLSAVALVSPLAAGLMFVEALVALAVVRGLSDGAEWLRIGSRFFGRERFFLVLVVATATRLALDGILGGLLESEAGETAHSIGLVLVPLITHALDKNGPVRGSVQVIALTALTGALVAGLIAATNLTLADLSLTFDDVAYAIEQHPKAYLVLLCGAFLAARANAAFGWDFHGIIVPGLLAVAWFEPVSVLVTLAEAILVLLLARGVIKLPGLRRLPLDGGRRLMLVFCADAVLKFAIVGLLGPQVPALRPSDLYGFGYLLPALLADKMWQRLSVTRVVLPAVQVSVAGFIVGNALIWLLTRSLSWMAPAAQAELAVEPVPAARALAVSRAAVARDGGRTRLSSEETRRWRAALDEIAEGVSPPQATARLAAPDVEVAPLAGEHDGVVVRERVARLAELRGLGTVVARGYGKRVVVAVPRPLEGDTSLMAAAVADAVGARIVVVAGRPVGGGPLELLPTSRTPYGIAASALAGHAWIELKVDERAPPAGRIEVGPAVWPEVVDLRALRELVPGAELHWTGTGGAVVLAAPAATWRDLAARPCVEAAGRVRPWATLLAARPPRLEEDLDVLERLLYAETVVRPLVDTARGGGAPLGGSACRAAEALGLTVATLEDGAGARHLAVLPGERWSTAIALRVAPGRPVETVVGAPAAAVEPLVDRAAVTLAGRLEARALLVGTPAAAALSSSYDAAVDTLTAALGAPAAEAVLLEVRGGSIPGGAVLTWGEAPGEPELVPNWVPPLERALETVGLPAQRYDGSAAHACCGDLGSARRALLAQVGRSHVATVFLSQDLRRRRFLDGGAAGDVVLGGELGLPARPVELVDGVAEALASAPCVELGATLATARRWAELRHIADLRAIAGRPGVRLVRDPVTGGAFVVAATRCGEDTGYGVIGLTDAGAGSRLLALPPGSRPGSRLLDDVRWGRWASLVAPPARGARP